MSAPSGYQLVYRTAFDNITGGHSQDYRIQLYQKRTDTPTVQVATYGPEPITIEWFNSSDTYEPIRGSRASLNFVVSDAINPYNFQAAAPREWYVDFEYKDSADTWQNAWAGWIVPENQQEEIDTEPFVVSVDCTDGLGFLNTASTLPSDLFTTVSPLSVLLDCIEATGIAENVNVQSNIYNTEGANFPDALTNDRISPSDLWRADSTAQPTWREIAEKILISYNCRLYQSESEWFITSNSLYGQPPGLYNTGGPGPVNTRTVSWTSNATSITISGSGSSWPSTNFSFESGGNTYVFNGSNVTSGTTVALSNISPTLSTSTAASGLTLTNIGNETVTYVTYAWNGSNYVLQTGNNVLSENIIKTTGDEWNVRDRGLVLNYKQPVASVEISYDIESKGLFSDSYLVGNSAITAAPGITLAYDTAQRFNGLGRSVVITGSTTWNGTGWPGYWFTKDFSITTDNASVFQQFPMTFSAKFLMDSLASNVVGVDMRWSVLYRNGTTRGYYNFESDFWEFYNNEVSDSRFVERFNDVRVPANGATDNWQEMMSDVKPDYRLTSGGTITLRMYRPGALDSDGDQVTTSTGIKTWVTDIQLETSYEEEDGDQTIELVLGTGSGSAFSATGIYDSIGYETSFMSNAELGEVRTGRTAEGTNYNKRWTPRTSPDSNNQQENSLEQIVGLSKLNDYRSAYGYYEGTIYQRNSGEPIFPHHKLLVDWQNYNETYGAVIDSMSWQPRSNSYSIQCHVPNQATNANYYRYDRNVDIYAPPILPVKIPQEGITLNGSRATGQTTWQFINDAGTAANSISRSVDGIPGTRFSEVFRVKTTTGNYFSLDGISVSESEANITNYNIQYVSHTQYNVIIEGTFPDLGSGDTSLAFTVSATTSTTSPASSSSTVSFTSTSSSLTNVTVTNPPTQVGVQGTKEVATYFIAPSDGREITTAPTYTLTDASSIITSSDIQVAKSGTGYVITVPYTYGTATATVNLAITASSAALSSPTSSITITATKGSPAPSNASEYVLTDSSFGPVTGLQGTRSIIGPLEVEAASGYILSNVTVTESATYINSVIDKQVTDYETLVWFDVTFPSSDQTAAITVGATTSDDDGDEVDHVITPTIGTGVDNCSITVNSGSNTLKIDPGDTTSFSFTVEGSQGYDVRGLNVAVTYGSSSPAKGNNYLTSDGTTTGVDARGDRTWITYHYTVTGTENANGAEAATITIGTNSTNEPSSFNSYTNSTSSVPSATSASFRSTSGSIGSEAQNVFVEVEANGGWVATRPSADATKVPTIAHFRNRLGGVGQITIAASTNSTSSSRSTTVSIFPSANGTTPDSGSTALATFGLTQAAADFRNVSSSNNNLHIEFVSSLPSVANRSNGTLYVVTG